MGDIREAVEQAAEQLRNEALRPRTYVVSRQHYDALDLFFVETCDHQGGHRCGVCRGETRD